MKEVHLSDEQFAEALGGAAGEAVAAHLAQCAECRAELSRVHVALGGMAAWSRAAAAEPAGFWYAQRQAIAEQMAGRREPSRLLAWAGAMATVVLAAGLITQMPVPELKPWSAHAGAESQSSDTPQDPDDVLMAEIQASLRRPVPRPFEPALLVTQALNRAAEQAEAQP